MVGFYRRMMPHYAETVYPLTELVRLHPKNRHLPWSQPELAAFAAYVRGADNVVADCLSRPDSTEEPPVAAALPARTPTPELLVAAPPSDAEPLAAAPRPAAGSLAATALPAPITELLVSVPPSEAGPLATEPPAAVPHPDAGPSAAAPRPAAEPCSAAAPRPAAARTAAAPPGAAGEPHRTGALPANTQSTTSTAETPVNAVTVDAADLHAIAEAQTNDPETASFLERLETFSNASTVWPILV
ncbi:hypothetical protein FJT64_012967 [Amphibalanus amphitrite]|uniref:Uncharacterized protein n=1 Tax=Amphibalanus amphitrite TaxID=1232801 RepID=A0A6A4V4J2_AMPAM|nr:hypothetical protein FJT64_012967 [Amphibalanus amphitrite]